MRIIEILTGTEQADVIGPPLQVNLLDWEVGLAVVNQDLDRTHRPGRPGIAETSLRQESSSPIAAVETKGTLQECIEAIVGGILLEHGVDGCIHNTKSL